MALLSLLFLLAITTLLSCSASMQKLQAQHQFSSGNSSFMLLPHGFSLSLHSLYNESTRTPVSPYWLQPILNDAIQYGFFPILSSPSFNSSSPYNIPGFSLGFYVFPGHSFDPSDSYLAVCAGSLGDIDEEAGVYDGTVVPVWMANLHHPIQAGRASLVVVPADSSNHTSTTALHNLQLRDGNQVVWNVSNVGTMEMADSGDFRIYSKPISVSAPGPDARPVFHQIPITDTDTLIEGQQLSVGKSLTSNDSNYSARMEKGGLALYLKGIEAPYWIFPLFRDPNPKFENLSITQLLSSAPIYNCTNMSRPPYLQVNSSGLPTVVLEPGSCSSRTGFVFGLYFAIYDYDIFNNILWSFLRLEKDGRLYLYVVYNSSTALLNSSAVVSNALDSDTIFVDLTQGYSYLEIPKIHVASRHAAGKECDVPLACGPLGVCTPGVKTPCSCSLGQYQPYFEPINITDLTQGCKRLTSLPRCTTSSMTNNSIKFVELKSTANVFLLNGAVTPNFTSSISACKRACLLDCSCHGLSYQMSTRSCFLMKQEISSLVAISTTKTVLSWNYTATTVDNLQFNTTIRADDYVTHLKVANSLLGSPPASPFSNVAFIGGFIASASVLLCLLLGLGACYWWKRRRELRQQAKEEEELRDILPLLPARFTFEQLQKATEGFSKLLGAGGCGSVYAGTLFDGRKVAVKVLEGIFQAGAARSQCKDFLAELATVGHTGHQNIVRLVGFCWQVSHRLLVYEYVERGSLDCWLFGADDLLLDWEKRYNIVLGVVRGLHYLHEECEQPILHFDIKPQNILLNDAFEAKLADFGMSRLMQRDASSLMTGMRGTPGYIAPEWFSHGTVSKKSDIYSMGVVMLEIVVGRKVLDYSLIYSNRQDDVDSSAWHLPSWVAKRWEQGSVMNFVDKRLHVCGFDEVQVQRLLYIALWCIHEDPSVRPQAATLLQWLESTIPIQQPPSSAHNAPSNHL